MLLSLVLTTAAIYLPGISTAFGFTHISLAEYGVALALAFAVIPIVELVKAIQRQVAKKPKQKKQETIQMRPQAIVLVGRFISCPG